MSTRFFSLRRFAAAAFLLLLTALSLPTALAQGVYPSPEALPDLSLRVTGTVFAIAPYNGGYVVGGEFDQINGVPRRNLAYVDANGAVADGGFVAGWSSGADAAVRALAVSGDALFVGGDFATIAGSMRPRMARLSLLDGSVDAGFQVAVDGTVRALALDAARGQVFLGGDFLVVGGSARERAAKVDAATGALVAGWTPGYQDATVLHALAYDAIADRLYVGGVLKMQTGGGHSRGVGRLLGASGASDNATWNARMHPRGGAQVWALAQDATHLYIGGQFRRIDGNVTRNNIAKLSKLDASTEAFNANADSGVRSLAVDGSGLLVGGDFGTIGGANRLRMARVDSTSGVADPAFSADADRPVRAIVVDGTNAILGGAFRFIGATIEDGIARVLAATGATDATFTGATTGPGEIRSFAVDASGGIIAGGVFDFVVDSGDPTSYRRANLLRLDSSYQLDTAWVADVLGDVNAVSIEGTTLTIGGSFASVLNPVGGLDVVRTRLARYDISGATPVLDALWNPAADGDVLALVADASGLYVGGRFLSLGGSARNFAGRLGVGGVADAWNPNTDGPVYAFSAGLASVVLGGDFLNVGATARGNIARVDLIAGSDAALSADTDQPVRALFDDGTHLYLGGDFASVQGNAAVSRLARLDSTLGTLDASWTPALTGSVAAIAADAVNGWLYAGGSFATAAGDAHPNLARAVIASGQVDPGWRPGTNVSVAQVAVAASGEVLASGGFNSVTNLPRGGITLLGNDGSDQTSIVIDSITPSPSTLIGETYTIAFTVSSAVSPVGTVTVSTDAGESCGPVVPVAGAGQCDITSATSGLRQVIASFSGAPEFLDSVSAAVPHDVLGIVDPTHVGSLLEATDATAIADGIDTGSVRVTLVDLNGDPVPNVRVSFASDSGTTQFATISGHTDVAGQFSSTVTDTVLETVAITAQFDASGDDIADSAVVNGSPAEIVFSAGPVDPDQSSTLIEATDNNAAADGIDSASVRVTLVDADGNPASGVAVLFASNGSAVLASAGGTTGPDGTYSTTLTDTVAELVEVTALYDADGDNTADSAVLNGSPATVAFGSVSTSTAITAHVASATVVGEDYEVSVEVTAGIDAVGTVLVSDGAGGSCNVLLTTGDQGLGSCTLASPSAGTRTLVASFAGDDPFLDSASAGVSHQVGQAATTLSLGGSPTIIVEGDSVTFTWSLAVAAPGAGSPAGNVTVSDGGLFSCSAAASAGTCSIMIPVAGSYDFNASYPGDANFLGATAPQTVSVDVQSGGVAVTDIAVRHEIVASGILSNGTGDLVDYEFEVSNIGTTDQPGVAIEMLMPPEFADISWTCTPSGAGATCGAAAGNGDIAFTVDLDSGSSVLIALEVRIVDPEDNGVETAATAAVQIGELDSANNAATTFYRSCSTSEVIGGRPLPAHLCGFRDGFEAFVE